jgi:hypothetical protein
LDALDMLRIEAGLIFAGYEFCDQVDPFEAGIGFAVPLKSKQDWFAGREALERRKAAPQRTLVGLELAGNEAAAHGDCVHAGRSQVGVITSATRSPLLRTNIALCRMAVEYAQIGTDVEVGKLDGHQKRIPARVVRFPFYDPEKKRPRSLSGRPLPSGRVGHHRAEPAAMKYQRLAIVHADPVHPADHDRMVPARVHMLKPAFDMRDAPVKQRSAEDPGPPGQSGELVVRRPREPARGILLIAGQHIDREMTCPEESIQARRVIRDTEQHQRRLKRNRGE